MPSKHGIVQPDDLGNIFYFGGGPDGNQVYTFDPATNVVNLTHNVEYGSSVKYNDSSDTIFILGGRGQVKELLAFNMETLHSSTIPTTLSFIRGESIKFENKAFIFTATDSVQNRQAIELDLDTYEMKPVGPSTLPRFNN